MRQHQNLTIYFLLIFSFNISINENQILKTSLENDVTVRTKLNHECIEFVSMEC